MSGSFGAGRVLTLLPLTASDLFDENRPGVEVAWIGGAINRVSLDRGRERNRWLFEKNSKTQEIGFFDGEAIFLSP